MKDINILVEYLQKLSNKRIILVENDDFDIDKIDIDTLGVFIPRRLEGRKQQLVKERLRELNIIKIYPDGSVDVNGDVDLNDLGLTKIPIKFNKVTGNFLCFSNNLISLENCPIEVGENFWCFNNQISSLEGCPKKVGKSFDCSNNNLTSLKGCPEEILSYFSCSDNRLKNLEGCSIYVGSDFSCDNNKLTSLENCPKRVGEDFWCHNNFVEFTAEQVKKVCNVGGGIYS